VRIEARLRIGEVAIVHHSVSRSSSPSFFASVAG
jgi:hypothetical protein